MTWPAARRLADLLMHLLKLALLHGNGDRSVSIATTTSDHTLTLQVVSRGKPVLIAAQPASSSAGHVVPIDIQDGVRMDLSIASEIAHPHGGRIDAAASSDATLPTFTMPLLAARPVG